MTVLESTRAYLCDRCGCFAEDVELAATFDELNVTAHEREALALLLEDIYGIEIPSQELAAFETIEDLVAYIEDRF